MRKSFNDERRKTMELRKAAAALAAAAMLGCTAMAAEYSESDNAVAPSDMNTSYQTMIVMDSAENVYFMDTASEGLGAGMKAALMSGGLEDGEYTLRLKLTDGGVADESFTVGEPAPSGTEMTYAGAGNTGVTEINGKPVETESRGYYYKGSISGGSRIAVSFTYNEQSYSYTCGGALPNLEGGIAVQIDNVPTSISDMIVTITG